MSKSPSPLNLNREHIAKAFLEYCNKRSGGHPATTVNIGNQVIIISNLTVELILRCLTDCFEPKCFNKYGRDKATVTLADTYQSFLSKDNSKLTPNGVDFMSSLMDNCVEIALKNPENNTLGLELY